MILENNPKIPEMIWKCITLYRVVVMVVVIAVQLATVAIEEHRYDCLFFITN